MGYGYYQRKDLSTGSPIGEPATLPAELSGLADESLADLSWADPLLGYRGQGFFPVDVPMPLLKARATAAATMQYEARFAAGFPLTIKGNAETLQMRPGDLINWLVYKDSCQDAIDFNAGDDTSQLPLRTTDNSEYFLTYNEGKTTMIAMRGYAALLMRNHWRLKDAIKAATNPQQLDAIDVSEGWPESTFSV